MDEKTETAIADADSKDEKTESPTAAEGQLMSARASINEDQPECEYHGDERSSWG